MGAQGVRPAEGVEVGRCRCPGSSTATSATSKAAPVLPPARNHAGPRLAFHQEGGAERGRGMVEVPPAVAPDGGALLPAQAVAREEHLEGLGEARLAGAVAAHHEGEAGARRQLEGLRRGRCRGTLRPSTERRKTPGVRGRRRAATGCGEVAPPASCASRPSRPPSAPRTRAPHPSPVEPSASSRARTIRRRPGSIAVVYRLKRRRGP